MSKQRKNHPFTILLISILLPFSILAQQPEPCNIEEADMTPTCIEACVICNIDGFTGRHESNVQGILPDDFCTFIVHNAQWIAFQAGSTNLEIRITVANCELGTGLEITLYKSLDCENFEMIANCEGGTTMSVSPNSPRIIETNEPLEIGQYYYIAMDGTFGDNCDWTFEVIEGSTEIAPLSVTAPIEGITRFCPNVMETFSTLPETGAVIFDWILNGQAIGNNTSPSLDLELDQAGIYELCVTAKNTCDEATPTCKFIEIYEIPNTIIQDEFCENDCYEIDGNTYCETGIYEYTFTLENGCDSTIVLDLTELVQPINDIALNICDGDTIFVGETPFFTTGLHTESVLNEFQCDSIVNLDLNVIICNIQSNYTTTSTICNGDAKGSATFFVENGTPPFTYSWQHLQNDAEGNGNISTLNEQISINNLPAGLIAVQIDDTFGNSDVLLIEIVEPPTILVEANLVDYNGFNVSCNGFNDGNIQLSSSGGQMPYAYSWSNGGNTNNINLLSAGNYTFTLTDNLGCEYVEELTLTEPSPISSTITFSNPTCEGLSTGIIQFNATNGGVGDYQYSVDGINFSEDVSFDQLFPDEYSVQVVDGNNCNYEESIVLVAPQIPVLSGATNYTTQLGCELNLGIALNDIDIQQIEWMDSSYLDCSNCISPNAIPNKSGENRIMVTSIDGCVDSLSIFIEVEKLREYYAPNIFSPNDDGINDVFSISGSKEVASIDLQIFDRWGNLLFEQTNMNPINAANAWNGRYKGREVDTGIYIWIANINFIDGESDFFSGDVMLVR